MQALWEVNKDAAHVLCSTVSKLKRQSQFVGSICSSLRQAQRTMQHEKQQQACHQGIRCFQ
jgi:hypothetical protein